MNAEQKDKYIELQTKLIIALQDQLKNTGHAMRVLEALKEIQAFEDEDSLPCNQE